MRTGYSRAFARMNACMGSKADDVLPYVPSNKQDRHPLPGVDRHIFSFFFLLIPHFEFDFNFNFNANEKNTNVKQI
jgi:hypothetical protein